MIHCLLLLWMTQNITDKPILMIRDFSDTSSQKIFNTQKGQNSALVHAFMEHLATNLAFSFRIVEREKLPTLLEEQALTKSGLVTRNGAKPDLTGASYLLTGSFIEIAHIPKTFEGYGVTYQSHSYRMRVVYKIVDTSTGEVVFPDTETVVFPDVKKGERPILGNRQKLEEIARTLAWRMAEQVALGIEGYFKERSDYGSLKFGANTGVVLKITSVPEGADVEVDGFYRGSTPMEVPVSRGIHTVVLTRSGYPPWRKKINVQEDLTINPTLKTIKE